jgi:hypothetical protein
MPCIGAGKREHVIEEERCRFRFRHDSSKYIRALGIDPRVAQCDFGHRSNQRERTPQLVRSIGGEARNLADRAFEAGQHFIAGLGQAL